MGLCLSVFTDVFICVELRLAEVIRANSPLNKVMDLAARIRPATAEDPIARVSMGRQRHRAAPNTNHHGDPLLARVEARVIRLLADSRALVMERRSPVRDMADRPRIVMKPRAEVKLPVTTTRRVRPVRYAS